MSDTIPAIRKVSLSFGYVQVLSEVDFDLRPGEAHAPICENGAGKSTTMTLLAGYQPPTSGEVRLNGKPIAFCQCPTGRRSWDQCDPPEV
jgi:ribose transport system ATP-binding protein